MFDEFKNKQENAYNILINEINSNRISHAYLVDENNNSEAFEFVLSFVKEVLGKGLSDDERVQLYKRIDDDNYPEIKLIVPDGTLIKKQQILDLQQEFSMKAIEGNKRVYIIRSADKMRSETANSMLKFLEEPENDILAILMTNNYNGILKTIVSRCQLIKLVNDNNVKNDDISFEKIINFTYYLEKNGVKTILKEQEMVFDFISPKDRVKWEDFFDKVIDVYYDIMKVLLGTKKNRNDLYIDKINEMSELNSLESINKKINYLLNAKEKIKYNVNINLLLDDLIVNIGGINEDSRCKVWR